MKINSIGFLGWYEHGNMGDEAMLEGMQYLFEKHLSVKKFVSMVDYEASKLPAITRDLANSNDLFVLGGGELINPDRLFMSINKWQKCIKIPKIILGCGVNTSQYDLLNDSVRSDLKDFNLIGLRDYPSVQILEEGDPTLKGKIFLSLDPAIALIDKYEIDYVPEKHTAVIVPTDRVHRTYDAGIREFDVVNKNKDYVKNLLIQKGVEKVKLLAFGGDDNNDYVSCEQLVNHLGKDFSDVVIKKPVNPKETLVEMADCELSFPFRLHAMIFSYMLDIPYYFIPYHRKLFTNNDTLDAFPKVVLAHNHMKNMWRKIGEVGE